MKTHFAAFAVAVLLVSGAALPGHAENAAASKAPAAIPSAAPYVSGARPSPAPNIAAEAAANAAVAANSERPTAGRHRHFGRFRIAHWRPFSIHLPHFHRHSIHWRRFS